MAINWSDPTSVVSKYFKVRECLYLPKYNRLADERDGLNDEIKNNLVDLFNKMDAVRDFIGLPIIVHEAYRPPAYNALVGGAKSSAHMQGKAVDFHVANNGADCDGTRAKFLPKLDEWNMRMEDLPGSAWVHLDTAPVISHRFFKP